jgi:FkbM family methyltransferase
VHLISDVVEQPDSQLLQHQKGCLVGSFWSEAWFNLLCNTVANSGIALDWYGNPDYHWLKQSSTDLEQQGITPKDLISEEDLVTNLRRYPYIVVQIGTLDERDDLQAVSQFSLPSRIVFALATANLPMILVGSPNSAAANFVKHFGLGIVCDYSPESLKEAVNHICLPQVQQEIRESAVKIAPKFSDQGIGEWVWQSLAIGQACDSRFEQLLPRSPASLVHFIEPPAPADIYRDFIPVYQVMRRLKNQGFSPSFVLDVGASSGIWSHTAGQIFLDSRFILIDPLMSKYGEQARDYYLKRTPNPTFLECAVSNQAGQTTFQVSPDLYGSSLLNPADFRTYETIEVTIRTLDEIASEQALSGRGMLKIDVQCAEHLVLEGASQLMPQIDAIIIELSFVRYDLNALVFSEMLELLTSLGFRYYDETGDWRSPIDGTLLQKEIVFLRNNLFVPPTS